MWFRDCLSTTKYVSGDMTHTHVREVPITHFRFTSGYKMAAYRKQIKTEDWLCKIAWIW